MNALAIPVTLGLLACAATAQGCFETDLGKSIGNIQDTINPIEPIGFAFPLHTGTYTDIHISDHGIAWLSNGGFPPPPSPALPLVYTPDPMLLPANGPAIAPLWADTIPGAIGELFIKSTPTKCTVTWRDVHSFGFPTPTFTIQMSLYPSGLIEFRYGPNVTNNSTFGGTTDNGVVGVTSGGLALLPLPVDMSLTPSTSNRTIYEAFVNPGGFDLPDNGIDIVPLFPGYVVQAPLGPPANCASSLSYGSGCGGLGICSTAPVIGGDWHLTATGVDAISPFAIFFLSTSQLSPAVPFTTLGFDAPGCDVNIGAPLLGDLTGSNNGGIAAVALPIPNDPMLAGATLTAQAICVTLSNGANLLSSNGNQGTLDIN